MWTETPFRQQKTFKKVLGADKDKVCHNQTLGNNNKDAQPCLTAKVAFFRVKINVMYIYIVIVIPVFV